MFFQDLKIPATYYLIDTPKQLSWLRSELLQSKEFAYDIETNDPTTASKKSRKKFKNLGERKVVGISFSWGREDFPMPWIPGRAAYVPLITTDDKDYWGTRQEAVYAVLKEILESDIPKVDQNGKFDISTLWKLSSMAVQNANFDTMLAHGMLDEEGIYCSHALKSDYNDKGEITKLGMSDFYLQLGSSQFKKDLGDALDFYDPKYRRYSKVPLDILYPYGCADADFTLCLKIIFQKYMELEGTLWAFENIVMPLRKTLMIAELHGTPLDIKRAEEVRVEQDQIMKDVEGEVFVAVGRVFNLDSDKELGRVLFEEMGLPGSKTDHGNWKTDADSLSVINHPVKEPLLKYSRAKQIHNNYAVACLERVVDPSGEGIIGWIHPDYFQISRTGRLRCTDPNLATLPKPENGGIIVKSMFACESDYRLVFKDFGQIELKVAAHISQEPVWLEAFRAGHDMHAAMAHRLNNLQCDISEVKKLYPQFRSEAKAVNFGIIYGQTAYGLANEIGRTVEEAEEIINNYYLAAPVLKAWIDSTHSHLEAYGQVDNLFNRVRHLPDAQLAIPSAMRWPDQRKGCYRNGPYPTWLNRKIDEIVDMDESEIRSIISSHKFRSSYEHCIGCPHLKSCIINREVKYIKSKKQYAMRQGVNHRIQSSAVDMCSLCMVWSGDEFRRQGLRATPILHLHDEICVYAHVEDVEKVERIMEYYMTDYLHKFTNFSVPLTTDTEIVHRWSDKHKEE